MKDFRVGLKEEKEQEALVVGLESSRHELKELAFCLDASSAKSGHPESNQGPSDCCMNLQSDALPTEL